jgi:hypothetical protein
MQRLLFDESIDVNGETCIRRLVRFFIEQGSDADFARWQALLTQPASQNLFIPQWKAMGWTETEARDHYRKWIDGVGSLETYARSARNYETTGNGGQARLTPLSQVKQEAVQRWSAFLSEGITCAINARHPFMLWHHSDYGRIGCDDEHRWLLPLCDECHALLRQKGPGLSATCPQPVLRWIS